MSRDGLYLTNIAECIQKIEAYTKEGRETFLINSMAQDAVIRNLEIIGEATKRLSPEIRDNNPDIPWRRMTGLRDVLIHDYGKVDVDEVWGIVEKDLPLLKKQVDLLLQKFNNSEEDKN